MRTTLCLLAASMFVIQCTWRSPAGIPVRIHTDGSRALSDMSCFVISITGDGITRSPHALDACAPLGIHPGTVTLTALRNGITVDNVSLGTRTIEIYGIKTAGICPSTTSELLAQSPRVYRIATPWTGELNESMEVKLPEIASPDTSELSASCRTGGRLGTGQLHTCHIRQGIVSCWGGNIKGQLGLGHLSNVGDEPSEMGSNLLPAQLGAGRTAKQVALGLYHSCALLDNGAVKCWGHNAHGVLGQEHTNDLGDEGGEMGDSLPAVNLGTGRSAIQIASGNYHVCALLDDGTVKCWGANDYGQLGQGHANALGNEANEMGDSLSRVDLGSGRTAKQITTGQLHSCALLDNNAIKCWGYNEWGLLGLGHTNNAGDDSNEMGDNLSAVDLGTGRSAVQISAGSDHTCAILDDRSLKCWGRNRAGGLGLGHTLTIGDEVSEMGSNLQSVDLGSGRHPLRITAGWSATCALLDNHSLKCWGNNTNGQLGLEHATDIGTVPNVMGDNLATVQLGQNRQVNSISFHYGHACAALDDGNVKCWGSNSAGNLGQGHSSSLGDGAGEMGDNLSPVDLGTLRQASLATNPVRYLDRGRKRETTKRQAPPETAARVLNGSHSG